MSRNISTRSFLAMVRAERMAKLALVSGGKFNRAGIMRQAVRYARDLGASLGSWQARMRIALRSIWKRAKAAMAQACAPKPVPARDTAAIRSRLRIRPYPDGVFHSGSRAAVHGW